MQLSKTHVIVVGGAIGGSAAALLFARAGARVTVFERVAQPRALGAGIAIAANGHAVLDSLGLGPPLDVAPLVTNGRIVDGFGRLLLEPMRGMPPVRVLRRATLAGILLDALASAPRVTARFGATVVAVDPSGRVTVDVEGRRETVTADVVIGADGVHSRVRETGSFGAVVRRTGVPYFRALVAPGLERNEEAWTAAGIFGSIPADGATYLYASAGTRPLRDAVARRDLVALRQVWAAAYPASGPILQALETWDALLVNEVVEVACERWVQGRVALLGDAAHAMAPNLGQGANSALVDAAVLLDTLRAADSIEAGLTAYEHRRRTRVARVARLSARLGALSERTHPLARLLRDRLLMPLLSVVTPPDAIATVLQEPPERLLAIGRAA